MKAFDNSISPDLSLVSERRQPIESMLCETGKVNGCLCQNCNMGQLFYTGQHVTIGTNFELWEAQTGKTIPDHVKNQYKLDTPIYFFACKYCGFGFFSPSFDGTSEYYSALLDGGYYETDRPEWNKTLRIISKTKIKNILEIGSGTGFFLKLVAKTYPQIDRNTFELSSKLKDALSNIANFYDNFAKIDRKFDMVCAFQLLEHLRDPFEFVVKCGSLLNPNGKLIISVPNNNSLLRYFYNSWTETPPHHLTRWTPKSLSCLLKSRGFRKVKVSTMPLTAEYFPLYVPVLWYRILHGFKLEHKESLTSSGANLHIKLKQIGIKHLPKMGVSTLCVASF